MGGVWDSIVSRCHLGSSRSVTQGIAHILSRPFPPWGSGGVTWLGFWGRCLLYACFAVFEYLALAVSIARTRSASAATRPGARPVRACGGRRCGASLARGPGSAPADTWLLSRDFPLAAPLCVCLGKFGFLFLRGVCSRAPARSPSHRLHYPPTGGGPLHHIIIRLRRRGGRHSPHCEGHARTIGLLVLVVGTAGGTPHAYAVDC